VTTITTALTGPDRPVRSDLTSWRIFRASAALSVIAGGLVAAVTGPLALTQGSWLAAYLVLVCGVGGFGIGTMQAHSATPLSPWLAWMQLCAWAAGNAAVIVGSLTGVPLGVDVGVVLLEVALVVALFAAPGGAVVGLAKSWAYRGLLMVLIFSAPIGSVLSHMRH